jgi:hypothetical protein
LNQTPQNQSLIWGLFPKDFGLVLIGKFIVLKAGFIALNGNFIFFG